jgi:hypothetical protein
MKSRDSSAGITLGYGLVDRGSRVRFPVGRGAQLKHKENFTFIIIIIIIVQNEFNNAVKCELNIREIHMKINVQ